MYSVKTNDRRFIVNRPAIEMNLGEDTVQIPIDYRKKENFLLVVVMINPWDLINRCSCQEEDNFSNIENKSLSHLKEKRKMKILELRKGIKIQVLI